MVPHQRENGADSAREHQRLFLWVPCSILLLGIWQLLAPATLGHNDPQAWVSPSDRGAWYSDSSWEELRAALMTWSDIASGVVLMVLGWRALRPNRPAMWWLSALVGAWLVFSPIALWAPTPASFANSTVVGLLVMVLSVAIPGTPESRGADESQPSIPPGWSYNPSSWPQRAVLVGLAFAGLVASRYLTAYQLGYIDEVWDPLFNPPAASEAVMDSQVSHSAPVSDAGLGAVAYTIEFVVAFIGGTARWRTSPYMVVFFGILVIPLGLIHTLLFIAMPVFVQAWCTWCFVVGLLVLPMVVFAVDEVAAVVQHLVHARRGKQAMWSVFWRGGAREGTLDEHSSELVDFPQRPRQVLAAAVWGASGSWTLLGALVLGGWLYASPSVFGLEIGGPAATVAHIGGSFVVVVAAIACAEVLRPLRLVAAFGGTAVAVGMLFVNVGYGYTTMVFACGVVIALLCLPRGPVRQDYGLWNQLARWPSGARTSR